MSEFKAIVTYMASSNHYQVISIKGFMELIKAFAARLAPGVGQEKGQMVDPGVAPLLLKVAWEAL